MAELAAITGPLVSGSSDGLDGEGRVLLGDGVKVRLRTSVGGTIQLITPTTPVPNQVPATVAGIFRLGSKRADEVLIYVSDVTARRLLPQSLASTVVQTFVAPSAELDAVRARLAPVMPHGAALSAEEGWSRRSATGQTRRTPVIDTAWRGLP